MFQSEIYKHLVALLQIMMKYLILLTIRIAELPKSGHRQL